MAEFSATDAALSGFRLVWEKPKVLPWWAGLQFVFSLALTAFTAVSAGPAFTKLASVRLGPAVDPAEVFGLFREIAPTYVVLIAAVLVLYAVLYAAMNRAVLRPGEEQFGYLRLSSDELRQLGLFALLAALAFVLYVAIVLIVVVLVSAVALATGGTASPAPALAFVVLVPVILAAFVYVGVRFSLASPLTFASQKIDLFGSWVLTRGRFWPLLGAYFIAFALNLVVVLLTFAIAVTAMAVAGGGLAGLADLNRPDLSSLGTVLKPGRIAYAAVSAIGSALGWPVIMTPPAVIYRALTGGGVATSRTFE